MRFQSPGSLGIRFQVLAALLVVLPSIGAAQPPESPPAPTPPTTQSERDDPEYPQQFFLHAGIGGGLAIFNSKDIENQLRSEFTNPFRLTNAGVDFAYLLRVGFRNIAMAEFRVEKGFGHKFFYDLGAENTSVTSRVEVEANVDSREWMLKANPVFPWIRNKSIGLYLLYGQGTSEYFGDLGVQFDEGEKTLYGVEFMKLHRWYGFTLSAEYHTITYESYADEDSQPVRGAWDASYWIVQGSFSAGFGE